MEAVGLPFSVFFSSGVGDISPTALFPRATTASSIMHEVSFPSAPRSVEDGVRFSVKLTPKTGKDYHFIT